MKSVSAVAIGGLCGSTWSVFSLCSGISQSELFLNSLLLLLFFSGCWLCFSGLFSEPASKQELVRCYRVTRFAVGLTLACCSVAALTSAAHRLSSFFSVSLVAGFAASGALLFLYFLSGTFLLAAASRKK